MTQAGDAAAPTGGATGHETPAVDSGASRDHDYAVDDRAARTAKAGESRGTESPNERHGPVRPTRREITFVPSNVWRVAWALVGVIALTRFAYFVFTDGGSVFFTVVMAWFASIAMEPAVSRLATRMKRGLATGLVMLGVLISVVVFFGLFGNLLADQLVALVEAVPELVSTIIDFANSRLGTNFTLESVLSGLGLEGGTLASIASNLASGVLGALFAAVTGLFSVFTLLLFVFYLSADAPRLRRWISRLFPPRQQEFVRTAWDLAVDKTGNYVAARVVLALINGVTTGIVLWAIGMPYWLPLAIWTGVVAQFVPTIGTYIAIALPVLVGLTSPDPRDGVIALIWALIYQQVENLTIEPRISARAVNVHPAVGFGAVLLGASLFGIAGALLAVPVAAQLLTLFQIYGRRYEIAGEVAASRETTDVAAQNDTSVEEPASELEATGGLQREIPVAERNG